MPTKYLWGRTKDDVALHGKSMKNVQLARPKSTPQRQVDNLGYTSYADFITTNAVDGKNKSLSQEQQNILRSHLNQLEELDGGRTILHNVSNHILRNKKKMIADFNSADVSAEMMKDEDIKLSLNLKKVINNNDLYYSRVPAPISKTSINGLDVVEIGEAESPFYLTLAHELNHINHKIQYNKQYGTRTQKFPQENDIEFPSIPHQSINREGINENLEERSNVFHHRAISDLSLSLQARAKGEKVPIRHIYQGADERYYETVDNITAAAGSKYAQAVEQYISQLPKKDISLDETHWEYTPLAVGRALGMSSQDFAQKIKSSGFEQKLNAYLDSQNPTGYQARQVTDAMLNQAKEETLRQQQQNIEKFRKTNLTPPQQRGNGNVAEKAHQRQLQAYNRDLANNEQEYKSMRDHEDRLSNATPVQLRDILDRPEQSDIVKTLKRNLNKKLQEADRIAKFDYIYNNDSEQERRELDLIDRMRYSGF